jgi:hypothetical protein
MLTKKLFVVLLLSSQLARSQSDSVYHSFPLKSFMVPGCLIAYGWVAYHTDATLDVNEYFKEEIWTENPHPHASLDTYLQFAPAISVYGLNMAGVKGKNSLFDASMIYLFSNLIMNTIVFTVKNISHEQRPDGSDYYSFPSGHTAEAFTSAEFLYQEYRGRSPWIGIAGYGLAASVGYLRMYNNKHWLHDVVAGAGCGIASTRLAYFLYPEIKKLFAGRKALHSLMLPSYASGMWSLSLVKEF